MSAEPAQAPSSVPTGNTFDKYGSENPVVRRLMASFEQALGQLFDRASPDSVLDVGCGEGVLTLRWAEQLGDRPVVGFDLPDAKLQAQWRTRGRENLQFVAGRAEELPFTAGEFDLVAAIETLEHIPDPQRTLSEMVRVARRHLIVSVPREPLWRVLNVARGAYLREFGNTPGHVNHWSKSAFAELVGRFGEVVELRTPLPWTMALLRVG